MGQHKYRPDKVGGGFEPGLESPTGLEDILYFAQRMCSFIATVSPTSARDSRSPQEERDKVGRKRRSNTSSLDYLEQTAKRKLSVDVSEDVSSIRATVGSQFV